MCGTPVYPRLIYPRQHVFFHFVTECGFETEQAFPGPGVTRGGWNNEPLINLLINKFPLTTILHGPHHS